MRALVHEEEVAREGSPWAEVRRKHPLARRVEDYYLFIESVPDPDAELFDTLAEGEDPREWLEARMSNKSTIVGSILHMFPPEQTMEMP